MQPNPVRLRAMYARFAILALLCGLALPTWASNVYRCDDGNGSISYVSKRLKGVQCKLLSQHSTAKKPSSPPAAVSTQAPAAVAAVVTAPPPAPSTVTPAEAKPASATSAATGPRVVSGQVYSYVDKDGVRNYSSARPSGLPAASVRTIHYTYIEKCYACGVRSGVNFNTLRLNTNAYQAEIAAAALEFGVEEAIVRAVIHAESAFNPNAISRAGAQGLMQLMPGTARRFGVNNAFDTAQNIRGGVQYLAWLLKRFNGDLTRAAAGYNAGEGAVDKYGGVPPYSETQTYVQRVGVLVERYRGVLNPVAIQDRGGLSVR